MKRVLFFSILLSVICIYTPVYAQMGGFGMGPKQNPALQGKTVVNKLVLYNASKYDSKKSGQLIAHEKLKREIIEVVRMDILSSYSRECRVQLPIVSQNSATLISTLFRAEEGKTDWDSGVLEYQLATVVSTSGLARILCSMSKDINLLNIIIKSQKRADDALDTIGQLQYGSYDKNKQGDYDRAVNIIKAVNSFKEGVFSEVFQESGDALDSYEDAVKLYPGFSEAYYQIAEIYRSKKKIEKAIENYGQAIRFDNNEANYYLARGVCYFDEGRKDNAMNDFNHVIDLKPPDSVLFTAYAARGNIYEMDKDDQKALQDYTKATELNRKAADIFFRKGLLNRKLKNYEDAVKDFDQVIELDGNKADAYYERGYTYAFLGDKKQVLSDYKTAAALGNADARDFLKKNNISWE